MARATLGFLITVVPTLICLGIAGIVLLTERDLDIQNKR